MKHIGVACMEAAKGTWSSSAYDYDRNLHGCSAAQDRSQRPACGTMFVLLWVIDLRFGIGRGKLTSLERGWQSFRCKTLCSVQ